MGGRSLFLILPLQYMGGIWVVWTPMLHERFVKPFFS